MADDVDSKFDSPRVAHAGELDDMRTLPGEFRAFRAEMRSALEILTLRFLPFIDRAQEEIRDLRERVSLLEASGRRRAKR